MAQKEATLLLKIKTAGEAALEKVKSGIEDFGKTAATVYGAMAAVVVKSLADYRQQEEAINSLSRAMVNQGIYSTNLKNAYIDQASALQKVSMYGDEQIIAAQAVLQGQVGQMQVSKELTQATLDLAAAKKMDLATAAELVGKTIGTETNALARQGIEVNASASKHEKLAQVIDGINSRFKGQAAAATEGLGALTQLSNIFSDIFEVIGERVTPVVLLFAGKLKALATDTSTVETAVDAFMATLQALTQIGLVVGAIFEGVGKIIGTYLAGAFGAVAAAIRGDFSEAFNQAKTALTQGGQDIFDTYKNTKDRMAEVDTAFLTTKQESLDKELEMEKESALKKSEVKLRSQQEDAVKLREQQIAQQEIDMELLNASEEQRAMAQITARIKTQEAILKNASDSGTKLAALNEIHRLNEQKKEEIAHQMQIKNRADTYATIATMASSSNKSLAAIGKAAAITQIAIETPVAVSKALSAFPPPFNFAAAGLVGAAMAAQAAQIAGVQLAEGGIVLPRPGGTQATIGEAGQAEAVIPLDRMADFGMGGGGGSVTIVSYGGLLGNEQEAREFARAVDRELLKLRQGNESVAFDSGVV